MSLIDWRQTATTDHANGAKPSLVAMFVAPACVRRGLALALVILTLSSTLGGLRAGPLEPVPDAPPAPALRLQDMDGKTHNLADLGGSVVLVNFWASWCPPCLREMPSLQRLRARLGERGLEVLVVNVGEDPRRAQAMLARLAYTGTSLLDREQAAFAAWAVEVLPTSFVIGPAGRVRLRAVGDVEWDAAAIVERIEALLDQAAGEDPS